MMNPYYQYSGYQWPGWGLGANRGGIMQKLQGGGDFIEDLMAQEEDPMMEDISESALGMARDRQPTGRMLDEVLAQSQEDVMSQIPPEILQGIVNQREPMMEKLMQMIMNMYAHTFPEGMEDPGMQAVGPHSMGSIDDMANVGMMGGGEYYSKSDYLQEMMEKGTFDETTYLKSKIMQHYARTGEFPDWAINHHLDPEDLVRKDDMANVGMMGGGTYAYDNGGYHDMYMDYKSDPTNDFDGTYEEFMEYILPMLDFSPTDNLATGGDYTMGAHVMGPGTGTSDSINAKLSDGEFVMTAQAVKNLGGGDRYAGARKMYNMMNSLDPNSARPGEEPQVV